MNLSNETKKIKVVIDGKESETKGIIAFTLNDKGADFIIDGNFSPVDLAHAFLDIKQIFEESVPEAVREVLLSAIQAS
jgi:hypothetical protein